MAYETEKPSGPLTYGKTEEEAALYREITKRMMGYENEVVDLQMKMVFNPDQARVFLAFPPATVGCPGMQECSRRFETGITGTFPGLPVTSKGVDIN